MHKKKNLLEKIVKKDYNNELEKVLETKQFDEHVKSTLLSILYKIEAAYKDLETVKKDVQTKEEYVANIIEIIKNNCDSIKIIRMNDEENKIPNNKTYIVDKENKTIIIYEAPHKMKTTLGDLKEILKDRKIVLARELTKIHEEFIRKSIDELLSEIDTIKGEMILIIEGNKIDTEECKNFDEISVFSKFIRPSGVLLQQNQRDLEKIFGYEYKQLDCRTDEELLKIYKEKNEAEVDANSIISLSYNGIPVTNITLNLIHNGFSRRSWLNSNMKDLYKGNGRVRHEYHNIEQGCLQNIQIHSYQSKDKHDINNESDFEIGGNNHYDIYVFKNSEIVRGQTLQIIKGKDIAERYSLDKTKVMNELARHEALKQFLEVVIGKRKPTETKSNILDHKMSVEIMSLIYKSGTSKIEVKEKYKD